MLRLILLILLFLNLNQSSFAENKSDCLWDNKKNIPCIQIKSFVTNSSKFTEKGIRKKIITRKQIEESGALDIVDLLNSIPDVNITRSGPIGQQASMFLRGTGSNHTLVMINGIPINDQSTTQGLHDFGVDFIQTIQQIEVFPGSSATHFGSNAIGGAINIILTGDFQDSISFSSDISSNYEFLGNKTFVFDDSSLNIKFGSVNNETISARGNSKDESDGVINYSTNINYEKFITPNLRFYNNNYLRKTKSEYDNSVTNQTGYEGDNEMGTLQFGLEKSDQNHKNNSIIYFNFYDRKYDERNTVDTYESRTFGIKYDLSTMINKKISFGLGSEYKYDWGYFDNNGSYQASTTGHSDNLAAYGNLGINLFENMNLSLFFRNDNHKQTKNNQTYKINIEKNINNFNFGVSYMKGLRNPTLYEMFGTDNFGYSGNRNLNPEKSNTYEIYNKINFNDNIGLNFTIFKSNIKNNIEYKNNKYVNDNDNIDLNQSGMNSEFTFKNVNRNFKIYSSLLSSKKENGSDQLRRPEKNYGINYSQKIRNTLVGDFDFDLSYNHYGKHFDTHSVTFGTIEMDSTDIINLKLSKKLRNSKIYFNISNLLNESFERPHGYNHDKRIFRFGVKY